jgi:hypothetical protein
MSFQQTPNGELAVLGDVDELTPLLDEEIQTVGLEPLVGQRMF